MSRLALLFACMFFSSAANAWCWMYYAGDYAVNLPVPDALISVPGAPIEIDPGVAVGEELAPPVLLHAMFREGIMRCDVHSRFLRDSHLPKLTANLYDTGIPGIGAYLRVDGSTPGAYGSILPWTQFGFGLPHGLQLEANVVRIHLIKTGPVTGVGDLPSGELFTDRVLSPNAELVRRWILAGPVIIRPSRPTCELDRSEIPVPFVYPIRTDSATGLLATADFQIELTCRASSDGTRLPVWVNLSDASQPGNTSQLLTLSPGSIGAGIGLKVLFGGSPISFGPVGVARWLAGMADEGSFVIPLRAEVHRTGVMTAGPFRAQATFTIDHL